MVEINKGSTASNSLDKPDSIINIHLKSRNWIDPVLFEFLCRDKLKEVCTFLAKTFFRSEFERVFFSEFFTNEKLVNAFENMTLPNANNHWFVFCLWIENACCFCVALACGIKNNIAVGDFSRLFNFNKIFFFDSHHNPSL